MRQFRLGNLHVAFSSEPISPIKALPLNDGTDGFRFETPEGRRGIVRLTKSVDKLSGLTPFQQTLDCSSEATFCRNGTMAKIAGMGMRLYVELRQPVRKLHPTFAGK